MKKQIFLVQFLFTIFFISAQTDCMCLNGYQTPLYDTYHDIRYQNVDSIVFMIKIRPRPGDDFITQSYTLVKRSADGLTDTLEVHENIYLLAEEETYAAENADIEQKTIITRPKPYTYTKIKKYREDGKLSQVISNSTLSSIETTTYLYDQFGRVIEEKWLSSSIDQYAETESITIRDYDKNVVNHSLKTMGIGGTNYYESPPAHYFCTDSGYIEKYLKWTYLKETKDTVINIYVFDDLNRLVRQHRFEPHYWSLDEDHPEIVTTTIDTSFTEYKYVANGYDVYVDGFKYDEYRFREDGHRTDHISYRKMEDPDEIFYDDIEKYVYFKNGQEVLNGLIAAPSPEVYGIQGRLVIDLKQSAVVNVYALKGSLVKKANVGEGNTVIPLPKGIYIVVVGDLSYKVLVR